MGLWWGYDSWVIVVKLSEDENKKPPRGWFSCMARPERFELPTNWFEASYSIQLSYGRGCRVYFSGLWSEHKGYVGKLGKLWMRALMKIRVN